MSVVPEICFCNPKASSKFNLSTPSSLETCFLCHGRREILHVACGNNCTLILAGGVAFPSLFERAASVIRGNAQLWADVGKPDQVYRNAGSSEHTVNFKIMIVFP